MKTITMLQLPQQAERVIRQLEAGERFVWTYRGRQIAKIEPIPAQMGERHDPFYRLPELAETGGQSLMNDEIDEILYGE